MKKYIYLFYFLTLATVCTAQTWAPLGAKWTFGVTQSFDNSIEYKVWTSVGESIIGGHTCKIIASNGPPVSTDMDNSLITYEDSNRVYWYNMNQFTLLYDFNKNAGETWTIMFDTCSVVVTVDSTGVDTINGHPLKVQYVSTPAHEFNGKIIEQIGHTTRPTPDVLVHCFHIIVDDSYYSGLRCYEDSLIGFHNFNIVPSCNFTLTGIGETQSTSHISIYPNPADEHIKVQTTLYQKSSFIIYNSFGQIVKKGKIEGGVTSINVNNLPNGIYYITFLVNHTTEKKIFVVERNGK